MTATRVIRRYTDAEVDAIVATHTAIAAAHHDKYTDAEVDAIVLTHKNIAGAHHSKTVGQGFRAWRNTTQSIPTATATVIVFNTEVFDTDNEYDTANGKYTPQTAGYYTIHTNIVLDSLGDGKKFIAGIKKNGTWEAMDRGIVGGTDLVGACVSCVLYFNGSTDYVEAVFYHDHGSALNTNASAGYCTFSGWLLPAP